MRRLVPTSSYRKALKLAEKQGRDFDELDTVITLLMDDKKIPDKYRDHDIHGEWNGFRELHVLPDWLLIYKKVPPDVLKLVALGSHSELY